jgi:uncharacterized protein YeaC (DUF1315 family)
VARLVGEWIRDATTLYLTDPEFHARVNIAVEVTNAVAQHEQGRPLSNEQRAAVLQAAVFGAMCVDLDLEEYGVRANEAVQSMQARAEAMGMKVVARPMTEYNFEAEVAG